MSNQLFEELMKASDRIKSAKRVSGDKTLSAKDVHKAVGELLKDPNIPSEARKHLTRVHKDMKLKADREDIARQQKDANYKPLEIGQASKEKADKETATQSKVDEWMSNNQPKQVKELGHAEQYEQDVNNPKMRSKSAEKLTGGVKQRLATGEGLAVRDKTFGQNLDLQQRMKTKEAKMKAAKGPEVINVKANPAPQISDEHAKDSIVSNLMDLRNSLSHPDHVSAVDTEIGNRVKELSSGTMKKSTSESLAFNTTGQWLLKSK
jgi:hypothetical protein